MNLKGTLDFMSNYVSKKDLNGWRLEMVSRLIITADSDINGGCERNRWFLSEKSQNWYVSREHQTTTRPN